MFTSNFVMLSTCQDLKFIVLYTCLWEVQSYKVEPLVNSAKIKRIYFQILEGS